MALTSIDSMDTGARRTSLSLPDTGRDRGRSGLLRHGTAEQGSEPRRRSRGRNAGPLGQQPAQPLSSALPQTMADLGDRFDNVESRLDTIERLMRTHASSINHADEQASLANRRIILMDEDITKYKEFITGVHVNIDKHLTEQLSLVKSTTDTLQQLLVSRSEAVEFQLKVLETAVASMVAIPPSPRATAPRATNQGQDQPTLFFSITQF